MCVFLRGDSQARGFAPQDPALSSVTAGECFQPGFQLQPALPSWLAEESVDWPFPPCFPLSWSSIRNLNFRMSFKCLYLVPTWVKPLTAASSQKQIQRLPLESLHSPPGAPAPFIWNWLCRLPLVPGPVADSSSSLPFIQRRQQGLCEKLTLHFGGLVVIFFTPGSCNSIALK